MTGREMANRYFDAQSWLVSFEDMMFAARMGRSLCDRLHEHISAAGLYSEPVRIR